MYLLPSGWGSRFAGKSVVLSQGTEQVWKMLCPAWVP